MSSIREIAIAKAIGGGGGGPSITVEELNVSQNGTTTAPEGKAYSPVNVNVPNSYTQADEGMVVSDGALVAQTSDTVTENGMVNTTLINSLMVDVPSSGSGVTLMSEADWDALSKAQKRAYGLVAIQDATTGYLRGRLVNGANFFGEIIQSGTAASSASVNVATSGTYTLLVLALNSESSTKDLNIAASLNNVALSSVISQYHEYMYSEGNRRNYRLNTYAVNASVGDTLAIEVTNRSNYTSFVYALIDANITNLLQARSTADAACSGTYSSDSMVIYGTFAGSSGGTITLEEYTAGDTVTTDNPGSSYKSAYIFWIN